MVYGSFLWVPISPGIMFCLCSSSVRLVLIATNCGDWQHLLYIVSALPVRPLGGVCGCLVRPVGYIMPGRSAACNRSCGASVGDFQPMPFSLVFSRGFIVFGIQWVNMPLKVRRPLFAVKCCLKLLWALLLHLAGFCWCGLVHLLCQNSDKATFYPGQNSAQGLSPDRILGSSRSFVLGSSAVIPF